MDTKTTVSREHEALLMIMESNFEALMEVLNFTPEQKTAFNQISSDKLRNKVEEKNEIFKIFKEMVKEHGITS